MSFDVKHLSLTEDPFAHLGRIGPQETGRWPSAWITAPELHSAPAIVVFKREFTLAQAATICIHVSGDERYDLFLDGEWINDGPERGDKLHWNFASLELKLPAGQHTLAARVWCAGEQAAYAQISVRPGLMLTAEAPYGDLISTGKAEWLYKPVAGIDLVWHELTWGTGPSCHINANEYPWGIDAGDGDGWRPVQSEFKDRTISARFNESIDFPGHLMQPASLPPMMRQTIPITITDTFPANTEKDMLIPLDNYYCARPILTVSGGKGATIAIEWAEALYESIENDDPSFSPKGNRCETAGKQFFGVGDQFMLDGHKRTFRPLWWQAGRYIRLTVKTADTPIDQLTLAIEETRYPLEITGRFNCDDNKFMQAWPIMQRALQVCMHETYFDCPYYEQLQYIGDTRLQVLATYTLTHDDRLPLKAITMFNQSRLANGLTQARYPSREMQVIPPFSLWWIGMVYDFMMWRDDMEFVKQQLPGVRAVVEAFLALREDDGLIRLPTGWNFLDWLPQWDMGLPPMQSDLRCGLLQWLLILALTYAEQLERHAGDPDLADRLAHITKELATAAQDLFWNEEHGCLAEDSGHTVFAEHSQALALLSGQLPPNRHQRALDTLINAPDLDRATIYFSHYIFEALALNGRADAILPRLDLWRGLADLGFATTPEQPEPSRSDCHGWGAHPIYHAFASLTGIRPASPGFKTVTLAPIATMANLEASLPHPAGTIRFKRNLPTDTPEFSLPDGIELK